MAYSKAIVYKELIALLERQEPIIKKLREQIATPEKEWGIGV
jgi:hypothetical protein